MALALAQYEDLSSLLVVTFMAQEGALVGMFPYLLGCVYRAACPRVPLLEGGHIRLDG